MSAPTKKCNDGHNPAQSAGQVGMVHYAKLIGTPAADIERARATIQQHAGQRVRLQFDGRAVTGKLRPGLYFPKDGIGAVRFVVFGRCSDWRKYAEPFRADPEIYQRMLRSFGRPELIYIPASFANRITIDDCEAAR